MPSRGDYFKIVHPFEAATHKLEQHAETSVPKEERSTYWLGTSSDGQRLLQVASRPSQ